MCHEFILACDLCVRLRLDIPWVIMLVRAVSQGGGICICGQCAFGIWGLLWMQWCIMGFFCVWHDWLRESNIWGEQLLSTHSLEHSFSLRPYLLQGHRVDWFERMHCAFFPLFNCVLDVLESELQYCNIIYCNKSANKSHLIWREGQPKTELFVFFLATCDFVQNVMLFWLGVLYRSVVICLAVCVQVQGQ